MIEQANGSYALKMETFASVAEEAEQGFTAYDSSSKVSTPDTYDPDANEGNPDFFKRSNAEYYNAA